MNTEFIKDCVYSIEKQYKTKVIITKEIQKDISDIYHLCSGCSFMSWLNHRLYPEIMKNCLMNHLEYPEYIKYIELDFTEEDEEEDDGEDEQLYCEQIGCNYQTDAVSATEDGWCCADGTWSCIKCVRIAKEACSK